MLNKSIKKRNIYRLWIWKEIWSHPQKNTITTTTFDQNQPHQRGFFPYTSMTIPKSTLRYVDNQEQTIESKINKTETIEHLLGTIRPLPNLTLKI